MTLFVVGLLCVLLGAVLGAWYGFELADALHKPIYEQGTATCTCHGPRKT